MNPSSAPLRYQQTADLHQHIFDHWRFLSLWWLKQFARPPWFSSHQFNRSTWVYNFLGTILHRILVFSFNAFMESIYCIRSLRLCRRVFDHFKRLRPSWLQQSVQHCLLLQHHQPTCRSNLFFLMQTLLFDSAINVQKENEPRDDEMKTGKKSWRKRCKEDPSLHKVPESTNPDQSIPEPKQLAHVDPPTDQRDH